METVGYRLSPQQKQLWQRETNDKNHSPRPVQCEVVIEGKVDEQRLKKAIDAVVERHEILRTDFEIPAGMTLPLQIVHESLKPQFIKKDLSDLPAPEQPAAVEKIFEEAKNFPFALEKSSLNAYFIRLSASRNILILSLPALRADRQSMVFLTKEIVDLYRSEGKDLDEPFQYVDFAEWQNEILDSDENEEGKTFWREQKIKPSLRLYAERKNSPDAKSLPRSLIKKIDGETLQRIKNAGVKQGIVAGAFLLACWQILLWQLSGESEFAVGLHVDGRKFQEMDAAVGVFGKFVPVSFRNIKNINFNGFLSQLKDSVAKSLNWYEFFDWKHVNAVASRQISREPAFDFCFDYFRKPSEFRAGETVFRIERQYAWDEDFKIKLSCAEQNDSLVTEFYYDADKFKTEEIERIADGFHQLLESAVSNTSVEISELNFLSDGERRRLLQAFNQTEIAYQRDVCPHQLFEERARETPEKVAVVCEDNEITYGELNARANQLARYLRLRGVGPETLCGISVERSIEMILSVLAVFKTGGAYVAFDPAYPKERLDFMLRDAKPQLLITQKPLLNMLPENQSEVVLLDEDWSEIAKQDSENLQNTARPENLAYVIYTSGSTGNPKGVMITHGNLAHYAQSLPDSLGISSSDSYLHTASISFSSSVRQLMIPLARGASIIVATSEQIRNPLALFELIRAARATVLDLVPSFWRNCLYVLNSLPSADLRALMDNHVRLALSASEPLPADIPRELKAKFKPEVKLINMLGQTETTGIVAVYPIQNPSNQPAGIVPAGRPIGNTKIYLLDKKMRPVPFGATGEIYVGGAGVGRGYLNQPDLTAERFVNDAFAVAGSNSKLYKTGDFGRYTETGQIEFLGRIDNQVKIRGHRVELGAIEASLRLHEAVHEAVVAVKTDAQNEPKLVAYVVPKIANAPTISGRERYRLPNRMFIAQQNKHETDFFYQQIFKDQTNFKYGIKLHDGACVLDVGANIGFFTMFVQSVWQNVKVFAFEPIPAIFETLKNNVTLYGKDTKLFRCGLAEESKEVVFTYYPNSSTQSGRYADEQEERDVLRTIIGNVKSENDSELSEQYFDRLVENRIHGEKVVCPLKTLSQIIRENNLEQIDLLKIDAEKSEYDVLRGIEKGDWQKIRQITIEAHDKDGQLKKITDLLEENGFTVYAEDDAYIKDSGLYNVYATREPQNIVSPEKSGAPYAIPVFDEEILNAGELRQFLKDKLPEYYLPANIVFLENLPLSPNGKVDREALPAPEETRSTVEKGFVAPQDELQVRLTKIWEKLLGVHPIGIHDNFFELGGHSLLAVRLFAQIEKLFGKNLPLATLFEAPTIEQIAALLRQQGWTPSWSSLVTLQPGGTKRPFFCVHALGGNVLEYQPLARFLGDDQPFYALQSYGLNQEHEPHKTIEEMAAHYIKEMQAIQPEGPYLLGGRSLGGTVAFEMACQLQAQNQEVALLALLDTDPMGYHKLMPQDSSDFRKLHRFFKRANGHLTNLSQINFGEKIEYFRGKAKYVPGKIKNKLWQAIYKFYLWRNRPLPKVLQSVQEFNFMAVMNYVPKIYPGKVTLFWAIEDLRGSYDVQEGWNFLALGGVETHNISGNHLDIVKEPYVQDLAAKLKQCIEKNLAGENDEAANAKTDFPADSAESEQNYEQLWMGSNQTAATF